MGRKRRIKKWRAGVPCSSSMKMRGHKSESLCRRYAIGYEAMLREGADKLAAYRRILSRGVVVPLKPTEPSVARFLEPSIAEEILS